jgi:Domain of unknown function (DUF4184)
MFALAPRQRGEGRGEGALPQPATLLPVSVSPRRSVPRRAFARAFSVPMPLTPAHAAAAWPLARIAPSLPTAALVIGTVSPDLEYLLRLAPSGRFGHTPLGIACFSVPLALVVWAVFERFVRPALVDLLPPGLRPPLPLGPSRPARRWALAAVAATLGALSHIAWDSFTHGDGWSVAGLPALTIPLGLPVVGPVPLYRLLQHASTAVGSGLILLWAGRAVGRLPPESRRFGPGQRARALRAAAILVGLSATGGALNALRAQDRSLPVVLGYAAVGTMVGTVLAIAAIAAASRSTADPGRRAK